MGSPIVPKISSLTSDAESLINSSFSTDATTNTSAIASTNALISIANVPSLIPAKVTFSYKAVSLSNTSSTTILSTT